MSETRLAQKISQLTGVGLVSISGGHRPAVRIQFNPQALAAYGLNIDDVRTTDRQLQRQYPEGKFRRPGPGHDDQRQRPDRRAPRSTPRPSSPTATATRSGSRTWPTVVSGAENSKLGAWANTTPAIILNVQRQPGANIIQVVDRIKTLLPQIASTLPAAVDVGVLSDRTVTIRASVADVEFELGLAVVLVVVVIFVFLRTLPGTIIPSLSVPLSLVGTLGAMYLLGFSLDNLSLMALTIATGFVVDDAIVMIENIARYVEGGMDPLEAALRGSAQIGFTIISLTISLIAVLIPLLFMGEVVGRLFHEFAITLAVTIVISAVVSLTLVPMMCAKLIRHHPDAERTGFDLQAERVFNGTIALYGRALNWVLDRQPLTLLVAVLTLARYGRSLHPDSEGLLSGAGHRDDPGHLRSLAEHLLRGHGGAAGSARRGDPEGSRRREPKLVHRRRRHQPDAEHRPLPDQSEAARRAQPQRDSRSSGGSRKKCPASSASRFTCSRCRI